MSGLNRYSPVTALFIVNEDGSERFMGVFTNDNDLSDAENAIVDGKLHSNDAGWNFEEREIRLNAIGKFYPDFQL